MPRNKTPGDAPRRGEVVKPRSKVPDKFTGTWTKKPKKVRKSKSSSEVIEASAKRWAPLMKRLAKR